MKAKHYILTLIFISFIFLLPKSPQVAAGSELDTLQNLSSYLCYDCSCDDLGNCSCKTCDYESDNATLSELLSGSDCTCNTCSAFDITNNPYDKLYESTCAACTCDNETVRHLKQMFLQATDFSVCDNKSKLLKFPEGSYLEKCVREYTSWTRWPISCAQAEKVTMLKCDDPNITSLEGIQQLVNLKLLDMGEQGTKIDDLMPVRNLKNLQRLEIPNSEIKNIEYLTRLPMLNTLNLRGNHITDLTYLPYMYPLNQLDLSYQGPDYIRDITPMAYMSNSMQTLSLQGNKISDISALANFRALKYLSIRDNRITSIAALDNMTILSGLDMTINLITDLSPLTNNTMLNIIKADHNLITSIEPLRNLPKLAQISFKHNYITDISPVSEMSFMKSMAFDYNSITDVSSLQDITIVSPILSLRFTYNCIPEDNYRKIRFLYNIQDVHFENQCENYPLDNVFVNGENIVNIDLITGQTWQDNNTNDGTLPGESSPGGCSIANGKSTGSDIIIILAFLILVFKAVKYIGRKVW